MLKENVVITICGTQYDTSDSPEQVKTTQTGTYRRIGNKHVFLYDEVLNESLFQKPMVAKSILKISPEEVHITKKGPAQTDMLFQPGLSYSTYYDTPLGTLQMCLSTGFLDVQETEDSLHVFLQYSMDINYNHTANCTIEISISSLEGGIREEERGDAL